MRVPKKIIQVEDFVPHVGAETVERIIRKAKPFRDRHVVHVNSRYYGGGVAEVLS
ncbi:MAG: glycosyl transferase family 1, partial [Deltaproteobacteria bacterium]|nr:glycosyl transferase family 1 [Deltaproteobacteria bacterium]